MHFSYAGITCYYAILVWESLAANSDRAKPRASSRSRQPFKGQLNASLAQGGSTKALKNNFFFCLGEIYQVTLPLPYVLLTADPFYAIWKDPSHNSSFFGQTSLSGVQPPQLKNPKQFEKDFLFRLLLTFFNIFSTTRSAFSAWHFRWSAEILFGKKICTRLPDFFRRICFAIFDNILTKISTNCLRIGPAIQP